MFVAVPSCDRTPPPLRVELPAPGSFRSRTKTFAPRRARKYAQERPMIPAPIIATSACGFLDTGVPVVGANLHPPPTLEPTRRGTFPHSMSLLAGGSVR